MSKLIVQLYRKGKYEVNLPEGVASSLYDEVVKKCIEVDSILRDKTPEIYGIPKVDLAMPTEIDTEDETEDEKLEIKEEEFSFVPKKEESVEEEPMKKKEPMKKDFVPKGFFYMECSNCHERTGYFSKNGLLNNKHICRKCGRATVFKRLKKINFKCYNCGNSITYWTNIEDTKGRFFINCLKCNTDVEVKYNKKNDSYCSSKEY